MITTRNEFEPVPAFTTVAGCTIGTQTPRETTLELIDVADKVSAHIDCKTAYRDLAAMPDDMSQDMFELQEDIADQLNYYMPMPPCCSVTLQDNEWIVLPYIDDDLPRFDEVPEEFSEDVIYTVNDHGNVSCYWWNSNDREYVEQWTMV